MLFILLLWILTTQPIIQDREKKNQESSAASSLLNLTSWPQTANKAADGRTDRNDSREERLLEICINVSAHLSAHPKEKRE